ncbi:MAG: redoxin domain-containing protein [Desulfuromonadaceae bacterium]|nr:redoxin domain-containing protein [Desulfuromonadaceae bacterium]
MTKSACTTRSLATRLIPLWILLILLNTTISSPALHSLEVGMEAPDFALIDLNNNTQTITALKGGKLTIVFFWATWGDNSRKALQQMQALHQKYKDVGLSVIGINVDRQEVSERTMAKIRDVAASLKITFPLLVDRGLATFNSYGIIAVPSAVIIDKNRIIRHELSGFPLIGADRLKQFVEGVIENKTVPAQPAATGYQPNKKAVRLWNMGMTSLKSERTAPRAIAWFEKAIAADPAFVLPYLSLGTLYYKQHSLTEAKRQFELVLERKPEHVIALCSMGQILLEEGDLQSAEAKLMKAVQVDEAYLPSYYNLGLLKGRQGDVTAALQWFNQAEQLNPGDYKIFVYKGIMYEERKDLLAATASYKKALELVIEQP